MKINYKEIENLENIVDDISSVIPEGNSEFNTCMAYEFEIAVATNCELSDVTEDAKMWAAKECPPELYINHGTYIKDGMDYIVKELKRKPSSNRALFSLMSQDDISNSEDDPIPSFMIFQTCIKSNTLYCTSYFRALEVSTFLRINIEEIRLKIAEIYQKLPRFNKVKLVIFAFSAYHQSAISPLKKAKIDLMTSIDIYQLLQTTPCNFYELLDEKAKDSTVIFLQPLLYLQEALNKISEKPEKLNFNLAINLLKDVLKTGEQLKKCRTLNSRHDSVDNINNEFITHLKKLSKEFEKCH